MIRFAVWAWVVEDIINSSLDAKQIDAALDNVTVYGSATYDPTTDLVV